jgi:hypothetical protein
MHNHGEAISHQPTGTMPVCHLVDHQHVRPVPAAHPVRFRYIACPQFFFQLLIQVLSLISKLSISKKM